MTMGERIRERRIELNLTQDELAQKAGYKSRSSINKIEKTRELPLKKVTAIAKALDCPPSYIMGWVDDPNLKTPILDSAINEEDVDSPVIQSYLEMHNERAHSKDEQKILDGYRAATPEMRRAMLSIADAVLGGKRDDSTEKSSASQAHVKSA